MEFQFFLVFHRTFCSLFSIIDLVFLSNINEPCKLLFKVMYTLSSVKSGFQYDISTSITVKQDGERCLCSSQRVILSHEHRLKHKNKTFCSACGWACPPHVYFCFCLCCGCPHYYYAYACAHVVVKSRH